MTEEKFNAMLSHEAVVNKGYSKMRQSFNSGISVNKIIYTAKNTNLEDDKRHWITKFNPTLYDIQSRPHIMNNGVIQ